MPALSTFPDHAHLRLSAIAPPLDEYAGASLLAALGKLFAQFEREGRISAHAMELLGGGTVLALAWEGREPLSGCSHDKVAQVLKAHQERSGSALLDAPPIVVEVDGVPRAVARPGLRALVAAGAIGPDSWHWDLRCDSVGAWRERGRRAARETWLAPLVARAATP
jgi:hypothetical protein